MILRNGENIRINLPDHAEKGTPTKIDQEGMKLLLQVAPIIYASERSLYHCE